MLGLVQTLKQTKPVGTQEWDLCSPGKRDMLRGKAGIPPRAPPWDEHFRKVFRLIKSIEGQGPRIQYMLCGGFKAPCGYPELYEPFGNPAFW